MTCQLEIAQCGRVWPLVEHALLDVDDVLVVGWTYGSEMGIYERFKAFDIPWVTMIDIHQPNVDQWDALIEPARGGDTEFTGYLADVRDMLRPTEGAAPAIPEASGIDLADHTFGLYVWQHGPEHLAKDEALAVIAAMQERAGVGVILEVPIGDNEQPADLVAENPAEAHLSTWQPEDIEALGFECELSLEGDFAVAVWLKKPITNYAALVGAEDKGDPSGKD